MNFLETIVGRKKEYLASAREIRGISEIAALAARTKPKNDLKGRLLRKAGDPVRVIAEIKRASPSKGLIAPEIQPAEIARDYSLGGASAISVLTETTYFKGSEKDFQDVREAVRDVPLLRKDFIIDEYQVYESAVLGADAILLIVAALDKSSLAHLLRRTRECGMSALVEVHSEDELELALSVGAGLIGVNNRNLATFEVSREVSERVARKIPAGIVSVSESGISDVAGLKAAGYLGYHAVLIGEYFMRAKDRESEVRKFAHADETK